MNSLGVLTAIAFLLLAAGRSLPAGHHILMYYEPLAKFSGVGDQVKGQR
jgi:hypothetical protein